MNYNEELAAILDVSIALSAEKDHNRLFNMIITQSMNISGCDAGTLYLLEDDHLTFRIMKTLSQNVDRGASGEVIDLPPVALREENICAYSVIHREVLNIPDVYTSDRFDFSGPKKYDAITGYTTRSMIAIPLVDSEDNAVGVLQLINAMDDEGSIIPFDESLSRVLFALASQAAIAVSNMRYQEELKDQMWSFTEAMATAIDERTPYNASHSRNVAKYSGMIADYINVLHERGEEEEVFDVHRKEQLVMGALLHDIGKMVIPLSVMNKATRLDGHEDAIRSRLEIIRLKANVSFLAGNTDKETCEAVLSRVDEAEELAFKVNAMGFIDDDTFAELEKVLSYIYEDGDEHIAFFTDDEKESLRVRKGTLTDDERRIMESHVEITSRILSKVHFNSYFADSPVWAGQHHECLNGSGYPNHLTADDLTCDARIMAVADICDALLATDRPYKKPIPKDKAFDIMRDMAKFGKIDAKLVEYLKVCLDGEEGGN